MLLDAGASALARNRSEEIPRLRFLRGPETHKIMLAADQTEERQLRCLAFAMGHHERLGVASTGYEVTATTGYEATC